MTSDSERDCLNVESNSELPEVLDADEHGPIRLAFYDERVSDDDAFVMPAPENSD
ncbi:hypothetical protein [Halorussus litoreus]|uniref:hypothetical protein n=1 Tax=Halorussus litoreus TaxID=1710536 RepID=UPI0013009A0C|nr:hypothetical protein [Halorussus litoreus]